MAARDENNCSVRFFPVGNGDCSLLIVGETRILVDLSPRIKSGDPHYDLEGTREALLPLVQRTDGRYEVNAFVSTHPHKDHLLEADELLHLGHPDDYEPSDEKIFVEEIIYAPASFAAVDDELQEDAEALQHEIDRRIAAGNQSGNMVSALIGPDDTEPGCDRSFKAGEEIDSFGVTGSDEGVSAFVYAPRGALDPQDRNEVCAVLQFRVTPSGSVSPIRILFGGDSPWEVWESIHAEEDLDAFTFDLLLAPHHCSHSVFAESSEDEASSKVIDLFEHKQDQAKIVSSSFAIDSDKTPPSPQAAAIYKEIADSSNFYCTGQYPDENQLKPIVFEITEDGVDLVPPDDDESDATGRSASVRSAGTAAVRRTPQRYG